MHDTTVDSIEQRLAELDAAILKVVRAVRFGDIDEDEAVDRLEESWSSALGELGYVSDYDGFRSCKESDNDTDCPDGPDHGPDAWWHKL